MTPVVLGSLQFVRYQYVRYESTNDDSSEVIRGISGKVRLAQKESVRPTMRLHGQNYN